MSIFCVILFGFVKVGFQWEATNITADIEQLHQFVLKPIVGTNAALLFGGINDGEVTNSLYWLSTSTFQLELLTPGSSPPARYGHCGELVNYKLYVYGGKDASDQYLTDLWMFDSLFLTWTYLADLAVPFNSCSILLQDPYLYIFGSNVTTSQPISLQVNVETSDWQRVEVQFMEVVQLEGSLWDGSTATTSIDMGNFHIEASETITVQQGDSTVFEEVVVLGDSAQNYMITSNSIYTFDFTQMEANIVLSFPHHRSMLQAVMSSEWLLLISYDHGILQFSIYYREDFSICHSFYEHTISGFTWYGGMLDEDESLLLMLSKMEMWRLEKECVNKTSTVKNCLYGMVECEEGYTGSDCSIRQCPNSLILSDKLTFSSIHFQCSGHGLCTDEGCLCEDGWGAQDCSQYRRTICHGELMDNWPVINCECVDDTAGGNDCEVTFCYNDCTNRGTCGQDGVCVCDDGYDGADCSISVIPFL